MENLSIDKAVELLNGKHVSRRGRRPHKVAVEESGSEPENSSESSQRESVSLLQHNGSVSPGQQGLNVQLPQEKQKRKYVKKSAQNSNGESPSKDEVSVKGSDPVVKKRGRGRPRKNVEVLLVKVFSPILGASLMSSFYLSVSTSGVILCTEVMF